MRSNPLFDNKMRADASGSIRTLHDVVRQALEDHFDGWRVVRISATTSSEYAAMSDTRLDSHPLYVAKGVTGSFDVELIEDGPLDRPPLPAEQQEEEPTPQEHFVQEVAGGNKRAMPKRELCCCVQILSSLELLITEMRLAEPR